MNVGGGRRAVVAALVGNTVTAAAKFVAWSFTGSVALLAEAVHSVVNAVHQLLVLVGARRAAKVAGDKYRFGLGVEKYFWSFAVALVGFTLASTFAVLRGIDRIIEPRPIDNFALALLVLGGGVAIQGFTFRAALAPALVDKGGLSWWRFIRRSPAPELPVALLEGFAAQVGLMIAFVSIVVARVTDNPVWDGVGSLAVGILLAIVTLGLTVEMRSLLIGDRFSPSDVEKIRAAILSRPEVMDLVQLRTQQVGSGDLLVVAKIEFDSSLTLDELAAAVDGVERTVRVDVPEAYPMYIEPDLGRIGVADLGLSVGDDVNDELDDSSVILGAEETDKR